MNLLVTYDVSTISPAGRQRLRRVARICEGYGQRVQYSVFEVQCSKSDYVRLLSQLKDVIVAEEDSLRIYRIESARLGAVTSLGIQRAFSVGDPWMV